VLARPFTPAATAAAAAAPRRNSVTSRATHFLHRQRAGGRSRAYAAAWVACRYCTAFDGSIVSRRVALLGPFAPLRHLPHRRPRRRRRRRRRVVVAGRLREIPRSRFYRHGGAMVRARCTWRVTAVACPRRAPIRFLRAASSGTEPPLVPRSHHALLLLVSSTATHRSPRLRRHWPAAAVLARWQVMPSVAGRDPPARRQICLHDSPRRALARSSSLSLDRRLR